MNMLIVAGKHLKDSGEAEKAGVQFRIVLKVLDAFEEDFVEGRWFASTLYNLPQRDEIQNLLCEC